MRVFLDTSVLFKLYHEEPGTEEIDDLLLHNAITTIFLSEITKIEFASAVWKKFRKREVSEHEVVILIKNFKSDYGKFTFVSIDRIVIEKAQAMMMKYGTKGLRTLDSIQLASAVLLKKHSALNKTSDKLLNQFFREEGLPV